MTSTWDLLLQELARQISDACGVFVDPSDLGVPPKADVGDIAFGCFKVAKAQGKNPAEVAAELAKALQKGGGMIEGASAVGPYLNLRVKIPMLISSLLKEVVADPAAFGHSDARSKDTILFEYANPNTHKEIHIGHLRNFILGAAIARVLKAGGAKMIPVSYINDTGTDVAKCLWRLVTTKGFDVRTFDEAALKKVIDSIPESDRTAKYLGQVYTDATRALEENESAREEVSFVHHALEQHPKAWEALWQQTKQWFMNELSRIFAELGVDVEKQYMDSECVERAHEILKELEAKGIAKVSEGALIIDMEEQKLGAMLLRKTDGSLLYNAKDLALAEVKLKEYPTLTESLVLVDFRQTLAFRQLAEALKRMGHTQVFSHLGYGLVTLPEGAMSSRKGTIVTYQSFHDAVFAAAEASTKERHGDWDARKISTTARTLALAGIKYSIIKQDAEKTIIFDIKKALSFDGDTGAYVLYAATRLASIIKKSGWPGGMNAEVDCDGLITEAERNLALRIAEFVDIVRHAAKETSPNVVAQWCFRMAQEVNAFYRDVPVNDAPSEVKKARIQLVLLARHTLVHGLDLLGIAVPEEM